MANDTLFSTLPAAGSTYDETPYPSNPFPQTHPHKLGALGRLFGLEAPDLAGARVLELGCADGSNLLPMAQHEPRASFLGLDASAKQVEVAQAAIAGAGLSNVEIRCQNILDFPADSGKFDYIVVHGIYSWVPDQVRARIMAISRDHLADNGVAYVSYNAFPGWGMRMALRDMILYHTRALADPKAKVQQARALTAFLSESVSVENSPYGLLLKQELDHMKDYSDNYMRHDILEEVNQPCYFHEFMARAEAAGLQYLSETSIDQMLPSNFAGKAGETLAKIGDSLVAKEQYMDFVRNRNFRQTLLCHRGVPLRRDITPEAMKRFHFSSMLAKPDAAQFNPAPGISYGFKMQRGATVVTSSHSFLKAMFVTLAERTIERISFGQLLALTRERNASFGGADPDVERAGAGEALLAQNLLQLYSRGLVDIFTAPVPLTQTVSERPRATPLARYQAMHSGLIANWAHTGVKIDLLGCHVVAACDGTRNRADIVQSLIDAIRQGKLKAAENGRPVADEERLRTLVGNQTNRYLESLAASGFLARDQPAQTTGNPGAATSTAIAASPVTEVRTSPVGAPAKVAD